MTTLTRLAKFAWFVLLLNILVIIGGAYVRASGAGAGCGAHWPLCNGVVMPDTGSLHTLIEFSHRLTSGAALLAVIGLVIGAWRAYPPGHSVRWGAGASLFFIIMEALIGAGLVLFEYVAFNVSVARAYWMAAHLVNTFLLLLTLTLTVWWTSGGDRMRLRGQGSVLWALGAALVGTLILGTSGAITALGDTLVLAGGISPTQSLIVGQLIELRRFHPVIAVGVGALLLWAAWAAMQHYPSRQTHFLSRGLLIVYLIQLLAGAINVVLMAPVWLQLVHLLLADTLWIFLVLLTASTLSQQRQPHPDALARAAYPAR